METLATLGGQVGDLPTAGHRMHGCIRKMGKLAFAAQGRQMPEPVAFAGSPETGVTP